MTCTRCFQKIAPHALEKSCESEQQAARRRGGRGSRSPCGWWWEWALPSPGLSWSPLPRTLHARPRPSGGAWAEPTLEAGDPVCVLGACGRGGALSQGPGCRALSPRGCPWRSSAALLGCSCAVSPAELGRHVCPETGPLSLKACCSGASGSASFCLQDPASH